MSSDGKADKPAHREHSAWSIEDIEAHLPTGDQKWHWADIAIKELISALRAVEKDNDNLRHSKANLQFDLSTATARIAELEKERDAANRRIAELEKLGDNLPGYLHELVRSDNDRLRAEVERLRSFETRHVALVNEMNAYVIERDQLRAEIEKLKSAAGKDK